MNKQHLYTTLFLALSSAYLSACSSTASDIPRLSEAQQKQLASERAGHLRQTHVRFNALDKDEDGYISRAEFNRSGDLAFERMDTNKDGVLSAADPKPEPRGEDTRSEQTRAEQTRQQQAQRIRQPHVLPAGDARRCLARRASPVPGLPVHRLRQDQRR